MNRHIITLLLLFCATASFAQFEQLSNADGSMRLGSSKSGSRDSTGNKEILKGIRVWTVNQITGDRIAAIPDTISYLRMNTNLESGLYGQYSGLGNNGTPRLNRIFIDREAGDDFIFTNGYSMVLAPPSAFHFTNSYTPITNLQYNMGGEEDHLKVLFATNVNKKLGFGLKFDYLYAKGQYASQNDSHFNYSMWGSYLGDKYEAHLLFSTNNEKQSENGGLTNDDYVQHPEVFSDSYADNEKPTVLSSNYNNNNNLHVFLTHRYNIGFNRRVPMNEEEKKAKQFALESAKEKAEREAKQKNGRDDDDSSRKRKSKKNDVAKGRPDNAKIMGNEPGMSPAAADSTRISMTAEEASKAAAEIDKKNKDDEFMKDEFVPVTTFFHTMNLDSYSREYIGNTTPTGLYLNDYSKAKSDSINDGSRHFNMSNTVGLSMLEGFNKWMKAGLKIFGTYEMKNYTMLESDSTLLRVSKNNVLVGGQLSKHEGKAFHFDVLGQFCLAGTDVGKISIDGKIDLNFPLLGDTVRLDASGFFHLDNPNTFLTQYQSRHFRWDVASDFSKITHTHIEGNLSLDRTQSRFRFAVDNLTNYTYLGTSYKVDSTKVTDYTRSNLTITPHQEASVQVITAQLYQKLHAGILHWDNVLTFQKSTNQSVLPLPAFNVYSNLYLRFKIAHILDTDLGVDCRWFTKYKAPEYSPQLQSFVIQEREDMRAEVGNYPFCNVYANFQLKSCRFFIMMTHVNCSGKGNYFLTPHYVEDGRTLRFGINWNFFN